MFIERDIIQNESSDLMSLHFTKEKNLLFCNLLLNDISRNTLRLIIRNDIYEIFLDDIEIAIVKDMIDFTLTGDFLSKIMLENLCRSYSSHSSS